MFKQVTEALETEKETFVIVTKKVTNPDYVYSVSMPYIEDH